MVIKRNGLFIFLNKIPYNRCQILPILDALQYIYFFYMNHNYVFNYFKNIIIHRKFVHPKD